MSKAKILIIGGTHGVEPQSSYYARRLVEQLGESEHLKIIPALNPTGLRAQTRGNAMGVDLNRNMPSLNWKPSPPLLPDGKLNPYYGGEKPASETEVIKLLQIIKSFDPDAIVSIHTNHFVQNPNPAQVNLDILSNEELHGKPEQVKERNSFGHKLASQIADLLKLPLTEDIGYATPGSLGSYCKDIATPCITIEFDDNLNGDELWRDHGLKLADLFR